MSEPHTPVVVPIVHAANGGQSQDTMTTSQKPLQQCPLCKDESAAIFAVQTSWEVQCSSCGDYELSDVANVIVNTLPNAHRKALSRAAIATRQRGHRLTISVQDIAHLVSAHL